jgi:hypothetical protein
MLGIHACMADVWRPGTQGNGLPRPDRRREDAAASGRPGTTESAWSSSVEPSSGNRLPGVHQDGYRIPGQDRHREELFCLGCRRVSGHSQSCTRAFVLFTSRGRLTASPSCRVWAERLRDFPPCPPCTPEHPGSLLQIRAIARAMAAVCAAIQGVWTLLSGKTDELSSAEEVTRGMAPVSLQEGCNDGAPADGLSRCCAAAQAQGHMGCLRAGRISRRPCARPMPT